MTEEEYDRIVARPWPFPAKGNPAAKFYEDKAKEARALAEQLQAAKERNAPADELRRLERLLDAARYVGD